MNAIELMIIHLEIEAIAFIQNSDGSTTSTLIVLLRAKPRAAVVVTCNIFTILNFCPVIFIIFVRSRARARVYLHEENTIFFVVIFVVMPA